MELLTIFNDLVKDQFTYGGKKYASTDDKKEATDCLFDAHSYKWLVGTIDKYTYRYSNLARERDLLKIATYMYILWLKRGFHLNESGTELPVNTTVPIKDANFDKFFTMISNDSLIDFEITTPMTHIHEIMEEWSKSNKFTSIKQEEIAYVYICALQEWNVKFSDKAGQDKDTYNEEKK